MPFYGTRSRTRTGTDLTPRDFKSLVSAIPPPGHIIFSFSYLLYIYYIIIFLKNQIDFLWWGEKGSNLRRLDLQSNALPTELSPHAPERTDLTSMIHRASSIIKLYGSPIIL